MPSETTVFSSTALKGLERAGAASAGAPLEKPFARGASRGFPPAPAESEAIQELYRNISPSAGSQQSFSASSFKAFRPDLPQLNVQSARVVAQIRKTFFLIETNEGLVIADQHAAAEKVLYEKLLANFKSQQPQSQMLLEPFSWEVSLSVAPLVREKSPLLRAMGFEIEPFGGTTFLIKAYPAHLGSRVDIHSLLDGLSDELAESTDRKGSFERNPEHRLAAMAACKAAVKAGDLLDLRQAQDILDSLLKCEAPATCPHGRPTLVRFSYADLESRFRRT